MTTQRFLTKSRFKLGMECETKLFYTNKKEEYADQRLNDPFLQELANGGHQVGELAKQYFPGGIEVGEKDYDKSVAMTNALLQQDNVTIFEAAVRFENLFIRADVLRKTGNQIEVIEVKSKSFYSERGDEQFLNKNGTIGANWLSYFYDIAFQKWVVNKAFPDRNVNAFLMMSDKSTACPSDGLNQKFRVKENESGYRHTVVAGLITAEDLSEQILTSVDVDENCQLIYDNKHMKDGDPLGFEGRIENLSVRYERDEKIVTPIKKECKDCQFRTNEESGSLKSGFEECWKNRLGWLDEDFDEPNILSIWDYRKKDKLLDENRPKMTDVHEDDIAPKDDGKPGISRTERQWLQIEKVQNKDTEAFIDEAGLKAEFSRWKFPLHFIDFETSQSAIPFMKGHRPYEPIAFQFSHHTVDGDGTVNHVGEFLHAEPGVFPNFEFLRALKAELEDNEGTIFRYAAHENTYLCHIWKQLMNSHEADRDELAAFLKTITKSTVSSAEKWEGDRNMVDMLELVKRYYYDPYTNGSNSIKQVLPAVLTSSSYLQEKYSRPVYGAEIPSKNFENQVWFELENGAPRDPYHMLPKMFTDIDEHDYELLSEDDNMGDGGAALAAYGRLQYEDMSDYERDEIKSALLRYCELDTLAMVMIYEAWRELISWKETGQGRRSR